MKSGFTLAEVLIALLLLGILALFVIPKVLHSQQEQAKRTMMRESVAIVSEIFQKIYLEKGGTLDATTIDQLYNDQLNYLQDLHSPLPGGGLASNYVLPNGGRLYITHSNPASGITDFQFDYNLATPPNALFEDQIYFWGNWRTTSWCGLHPGQVGTADPAICPTIAGSVFPTSDYRNFFLEIMTR